MLPKHCHLVIIGAGPAGLMAAIQAYKPGHKILLLEKMPKPAIKLRMTGKGRCNITNNAPLNEFLPHFGKTGRFLKYAFSEFFNKELLSFFEEKGVAFKLERGERFFPVSDNAMEIANVLLNETAKRNIPIATRARVQSIENQAEKGFRIRVAHQAEKGAPEKILWVQADSVLIATGGKSYPKTGSTGDGYRLAEELGHTCTPPTPALVPLETAGDRAQKLQGLSLKNIRAEIWRAHKKIDEQFGEMVFTDFGVSGPVILTLSKTVVKELENGEPVDLMLDLKPALDHKKVDQRILREINEHGKQGVQSLLKSLLPRKMIPLFIEILKLDADKKLNQVTADERKQLRLLLKEFRLPITGYRSYNHAIVTAGGVRTRDINPTTMESRKIPGLYFAGEVIDIHADTGGYNLQAAFSTGWVAGRNVQTKIGKSIAVKENV